MNNYDRMHRGESKPRLPENRAKKSVNKRRRRALRIVESVLVLAFLAILLILFDVFGKGVANAVYGVLGVASIPYSIVGILVCVLLFFGAKPKKLRSSTVVYIVLLSIILVCFLQTITTNSVYNSLEEASYSDYLKGCFNSGRNNAGGYLYGIIAYPFLKMGAITSTCILAVLFFGVLLFAFRSFFFIEKAEIENVEEAGLYVEDILEKSKGKKNKEMDINLAFPNDSVADPEEEEVEEVEINYADSDINPTSSAIRRMIDAEPDQNNKARIASDVLFMSDEDFKALKKTEKAPEDLPVKTGERAPTQPSFGDSYSSTGEVGGFVSQYRAGKFGKSYDATDILFGEDFKVPATEKPKDGDKRSIAEGILFGEESRESRTSAENRSGSFGSNDTPPYMGTGYSPVTGTLPFGVRGSRTPEESSSRVDNLVKSEDNPSVNSEKPNYYEEKVEKPANIEDNAVKDHVESSYTGSGSDYSDSRVDYSNVSDSSAKESEVQESLGSSSYEENITPEQAHLYEPEINDEMEEYKPRQMFRPDDMDAQNDGENVVPQPQTGFVARKIEEPVIEEIPKPSERREVEKPQQNPTLNKKPSWQNVKKPIRPYAFPPLSLLKDYMPPIDTIDYEDFYNRIEQAFASYDLKCRVIGHTKGATYTQYALKFADGVVFRKVASLENDIKRKLCVDKAISIVNSVKGMDAIGLETVNSTRERVGLKQYITNSVFKKDKKLYFMLGVNVYKESYFCNILEAPHLLIAGTTGSGKSICINTIICSIIYNYSPDYVKFVLVDPKSVELTAFAEIPHNLLGCPVITADDCIKALEAVIEEMERRYALMNLAQCKQLNTYNDYLKANGQQTLPYIVVIIDELADLMLSSKKNAPELEKRISKLTAKSRAAGIHLIIATQRPSIDVLTGVIKNNIPTRIAFTMGDAVGSKVVLDRGGAEKLYGKGDMLYSSPDYPDFVRLQAPFLDESEVTEITDYVKANNDCDFDEDLRAKIFESNDQTDPLYESDYVPSGDASHQDTLFAKAVRFAVSQGVISISKIQRQYRIGFTRAAYIFDEMVKRGIVDEAVPGSSKPRAVLIGEGDLPSVLGDLDEQD